VAIEREYLERRYGERGGQRADGLKRWPELPSLYDLVFVFVGVHRRRSG